MPTDNYGELFAPRIERKIQPNGKCDVPRRNVGCDHDGPQGECACGKWVCLDCGDHRAEWNRE